MDTTTLRPAFGTDGPFATVLVDVGHDTENGAHEHELRVRAACSELTRQGAPDQLVERLRELLSEQLGRPSPVARLVVAGPESVLLDEVTNLRVDHATATYDVLPDLAPWVAQRDGAVRFVLALVDHEGGDVAVHDSAVPEPEQTEEVGGELRFVHHVPVGGWSALRYQRNTENVWARNAEAVVDAVTSHVRRGDRLVLLAGDPRTRGLVRDGLADTRAEVIELESGSRTEDGGDAALEQAVKEALMGVVVARRTELAHELAQELGQGAAAAAGVDAVAKALVAGQVRVLLVDPSALADEKLDPSSYAGLALPGGVPDASLRADLVLLAAAVLTDAEVSVTTSSVLGGEPVAALLRWEERPGNAPPVDEV